METTTWKSINRSLVKILHKLYNEKLKIVHLYREYQCSLGMVKNCVHIMLKILWERERKCIPIKSVDCFSKDIWETCNRECIWGGEMDGWVEEREINLIFIIKRTICFVDFLWFLSSLFYSFSPYFVLFASSVCSGFNLLFLF